MTCRGTLLWFGGVAAALLAGCAAPTASPFALTAGGRVWPAPPDPPRIQYIGELRGEASLGRQRTAGEALRELLGGAPESITFAAPVAVAFDGARVFVADPKHADGACVHVLDLGTRTASRITMAGGTALQWPIDVAMHGSRLAIADARRGAVLVIDRPGGAATIVGAGTLQRPASVAWSADGRELWVVDSAAHVLVIFDSAGREIARVGARGEQPGEFNFPTAVALAGTGESGPVAAVTDALNFRVQLVDAARRCTSWFGRKGDAAGDFALPRDLAFDSERRLYVLDNQFENVQIFDLEGRLLLALGEEGGGAGQFSLPSGISIDAEDRIWIADTYNRRVQVFRTLREEAR